MSLGAIPLTELLAYMEMFAIQHEDERRELIRYVQALDRVFLEHVRTEEKSQKPTPEDSGKERRRGR